jgi:hypothetical protein
MVNCCEHVDEHLASIKCGAYKKGLKILACWEGSCFIECVLVYWFCYLFM